MFNPEEYAGAGTADLAQSKHMPLLTIIQSGSPQYKKSHPDYATKGIEGCEEGDIVFTLDNRLLKSPIEVIPVKLQKTYTEWTSDNKLENIHPIDIVTHSAYSNKQDGKRTRHYLDKNELVYTDYWFVRFREKGEKEFERGIIALKSTQLFLSGVISDAIREASKQDQYSKANMAAPIFSIMLTLETESRSNDAGSWFTWKPGPTTVLDFKKDEALLSDAAQDFDNVKTLELADSGSVTKQLEGEDPY